MSAYDGMVDIFTKPRSTTRLAAIETRLRRLERVSWVNRQRYAAKMSTQRFLTSTLYGFDLPMPQVPVYVPAGAYVALSAEIKLVIGYSGAAGQTQVWAAFRELGGTTDLYDTPVQVFYSAAGGAAAGSTQQQLATDPDSTSGVNGLVTRPQGLVYRPANAGDKIYTLDFKVDLNGGGFFNYVSLEWGTITVEIR